MSNTSRAKTDKLAEYLSRQSTAQLITWLDSFRMGRNRNKDDFWAGEQVLKELLRRNKNRVNFFRALQKGE